MSRAGLGVLIVGLTLSLGGCSMDDVECNGGLFNAVGLNNKGSSSEPKLPQRQALVLPPNVDRIPPPGAPPEAADAQVAALADPEVTGQKSKETLKAEQAAYCKVNYEDALTRGDETTANLATGPLGPCRGSVLNLVGGIGKDDDDEAKQ